MVIPKVPGEPPPDLSQGLERVRVRVYPEIAGLRLDQALTKLFPWRTRSSVRRLIQSGRVYLSPAPCKPDGQPSAAETVRPARRVQAEDIIIVDVPPRAPIEQETSPIDADELDIVHEDRFLVAINKPPGLAVHPSGRRLTGTLINLLHARYRCLENLSQDIVPRLCHRLDRETSGLILVAKDEIAHSNVRKEFERQRVQKSYLAIVEGTVDQDDGFIDLALGPARHSPIRLKIEARPDGLEALTRFQVRERTRHFSLVQCFPKTGRQHQLRVHLASIGHPIVGDKLYGPDEQYFLDNIEGELDEIAKGRLRLSRHALHSYTLRFRHPERKEEVEYSAPLLDDMRKFLEENREARFTL